MYKYILFVIHCMWQLLSRNVINHSNVWIDKSELCVSTNRRYLNCAVESVRMMLRHPRQTAHVPLIGMALHKAIILPCLFPCGGPWDPWGRGRGTGGCSPRTRTMQPPWALVLGSWAPRRDQQQKHTRNLIQIDFRTNFFLFFIWFLSNLAVLGWIRNDFALLIAL